MSTVELTLFLQAEIQECIDTISSYGTCEVMTEVKGKKKQLLRN